MRPDPLWRRLLRYLSILLLAGPLAGLMVVWGAVSILSLTPDRNRFIEMGDKIMVGLVVLASVGLVLEFVIVPLILSERGRAKPRHRVDTDPAGAGSEDNTRP